MGRGCSVEGRLQVNCPDLKGQNSSNICTINNNLIRRSHFILHELLEFLPINNSCFSVQGLQPLMDVAFAVDVSQVL